MTKEISMVEERERERERKESHTNHLRFKRSNNPMKEQFQRKKAIKEI